MRTPWTTASPVRCRIKNWTSMFCPCRAPLGEERRACSSSPQAPTEATKKCNRRRQVIRSPHQSLDSREGDSGSNNDPCWPSFADEDYIVFCFGEDGTFDVLNDAEVKTNESRSSSRPVNRKLNYGEVEEGDHSNGREEDDVIYQKEREEEESIYLDPGSPQDGIPTGDEIEENNNCGTVPEVEEGDHSNGREEDDVIYKKEREEEESIYLDPGSPQDGIPTGDEIEENNNCGTVLNESGSSNRSNDSAGSFAFPVLRGEGIGSPVQMPRTEDLQLRKHKCRVLGFYCCRF